MTATKKDEQTDGTPEQTSKFTVSPEELSTNFRYTLDGVDAQMTIRGNPVLEEIEAHFASAQAAMKLVHEAGATAKPMAGGVAFVLSTLGEQIDAVLDVTLVYPGKQVPGFWAGGRTWRVRYASGKTGQHTCRTACSRTDDAGLHGAAGQVEVVPYRGDNPLYRHGPIQVAADRRHFAHADGAPFFWLGDTWWMGLCQRLGWPDDFQRLAADRQAKGFNVIQIVAGLYPDMPPFDERGANEAGFPWEPEYRRLRPEYFDAADRRLAHLVETGMVPCIVGAWGYFLPWMGVEKACQHWRYLIARYGAWPVVWCIAGEANLPYYLVKGFPFDDRDQVKGWTQVARYVRQLDPFRRPISIHPTGLGRLTARGAVDDETLLDFDMLQTGHGRREVLAPSIATLRGS